MAYIICLRNMVDCDFVSDHIHDDDDGDCEEDTRIDGERGAATRDRIISCNWQTPLLWMEVFWHLLWRTSWWWWWLWRWELVVKKLIAIGLQHKYKRQCRIKNYLRVKICCLTGGHWQRHWHWWGNTLMIACSPLRGGQVALYQRRATPDLLICTLSAFFQK